MHTSPRPAVKAATALCIRGWGERGEGGPLCANVPGGQMLGKKKNHIRSYADLTQKRGFSPPFSFIYPL